ncbi:MAG: hypothetical protein JRE58_12165 [Deltaproteobacteria bacterium]|nr:hypothetical protein [Deltaproteobacteria bacterium]
MEKARMVRGREQEEVRAAVGLMADRETPDAIRDVVKARGRVEDKVKARVRVEDKVKARGRGRGRVEDKAEDNFLYR